MRGAALVASTIAFGLPAPSVAASPTEKTARFAVTASVTVKRAWAARGGTQDENGCSRPERRSGSEELTLASRRPATILVSQSRKGPVFSGSIGALAGRFLSGGSTSVDPSECNPSAQIADCLPPEFRFRDGRLRLTRPASGKIALMGFEQEGEIALRCIPVEAVGSVDAPLAAVTGSVDERRLFVPGVRTLIVTGKVARLVQLAGDARGQLTEDVRWTLKLRRLARR